VVSVADCEENWVNFHLKARIRERCWIVNLRDFKFKRVWFLLFFVWFYNPR